MPSIARRLQAYLVRSAVRQRTNRQFAQTWAVPEFVTPHTLRHTAAMTLLHAGVDTSTIALWLGHASTKSTDIYLHADLALKEKALTRTAPPAQRGKRYHPTDTLLAFLEQL